MKAGPPEFPHNRLWPRHATVVVQVVQVAVPAVVDDVVVEGDATHTQTHVSKQTCFKVHFYNAKCRIHHTVLHSYFRNALNWVRLGLV